MGWLDVDAMLDHLTPQQWAEWQAKDAVDPIGHRGTHEVVSILGAMLAGAWGANDIGPDTFMHWRQKTEDESTTSHDVAAMALQMIGAKRRG